MIRKGSRIRHINPEIDATKGITVVFEIKNKHAMFCYDDFEQYGQDAATYLISDLVLAE